MLRRVKTDKDLCLSMPENREVRVVCVCVCVWCCVCARVVHLQRTHHTHTHTHTWADAHGRTYTGGDQVYAVRVAKDSVPAIVLCHPPLPRRAGACVHVRACVEMWVHVCAHTCCKVCAPCQRSAARYRYTSTQHKHMLVCVQSAQHNTHLSRTHSSRMSSMSVCLDAHACAWEGEVVGGWCAFSTKIPTPCYPG